MRLPHDKRQQAENQCYHRYNRKNKGHGKKRSGEHHQPPAPDRAHVAARGMFFFVYQRAYFLKQADFRVENNVQYYQSPGRGDQQKRKSAENYEEDQGGKPHYQRRNGVSAPSARYIFGRRPGLNAGVVSERLMIAV